MYGRPSTLITRSLALSSLVAASCLVLQPGFSPVIAAQLTSQQVNQFVADPSSLLKANQNGGGRLVSQVRDLMLSDACLPAPAAPHLDACNQALSAIIGLLANANDAQKTAIGTGLGEAAQAMVTTNPTLANDIQTALAQSNEKIALEAYQTTVGNQAIAAAGGGGGGGDNAAYQTLTNNPGGGGGGGIQGSNGTGSTTFGITGGSVSGGGGTSAVTQNVSPQ